MKLACDERSLSGMWMSKRQLASLLEGIAALHTGHVDI